MMVRPITQSRSARKLVQTCALAVIPLLFSACTAAVPGVPATNAPIALATPAKSAVTKPPSTKGVTTKGGAATGAVGAKTGTSTSSSTTGSNTTKTGTSTSASTSTNTSKTGTGASSSSAGTNTSKTGTGTSSNAGTNTSKTGTNSSATTGAGTSSTAAGSSKSSTSAAPAASAAASAAAGDLVMLRANGAHGSMLTDAKGMTLYVFDKDSKDMSTCTGDCLTKWPAFTAASATAAMKSAAGVTGKLGTIKRADGKFQVTINGMPLYYYYQDKQPGDAKGQAVGNVWWEVGANGSKITQ